MKERKKENYTSREKDGNANTRKKEIKKERKKSLRKKEIFASRENNESHLVDEQIKRRDVKASNKKIAV